MLGPILDKAPTGALLLLAMWAFTPACAQKTNDGGEVPASAEYGTTIVPGSLHGTVRTTDGNPVANANITVASTDDPPKAIPEIAVLTDANGRYEWPLTPGRYRISVTVDNKGTATGDTDIIVGTEPVLDLIIR